MISYDAQSFYAGCFQPILSAVRATNRQLYRETLEFISYPRLHMYIFTTPKLKMKMPLPTLKLLSDGFVRENTVKVILGLYCDSRALFHYDIRQSQTLSPHSVLPWLTRTLRNGLSKAPCQRQDGEPKFLTPMSIIKTAIEELKRFPELTHIEIRGLEGGLFCASRGYMLWLFERKDKDLETLLRVRLDRRYGRMQFSLRKLTGRSNAPEKMLRQYRQTLIGTRPSEALEQ